MSIVARLEERCHDFYEENHFPLYHNWAHVQEVLEAVGIICAQLNIEGLAKEDLQIAALGHDMGHLESALNHEERSWQLFKPMLREEGLSEDRQERIYQIILATDIQKAAQSLSDRIIKDADLYYLGTEQYFQRADLYRKELAEQGQSFEDSEWWRFQISFLGQHHYQVPEIEQLLKDTRAHNLDQIYKQLENEHTSSY